MVARALAQEPRILLLDEPTSHLDLANTHRILEVLQRLRAAGQTVLFSTHDPNSAAAVADYVILLREGEVQTAGRTAEVLTSEHLSATYGVPVEVVPLRDRLFVVAPTGDPERVVLPV
jgi:iron complex transport system ATP-binding protein